MTLRNVRSSDGLTQVRDLIAVEFGAIAERAATAHADAEARRFQRWLDYGTWNDDTPPEAGTQLDLFHEPNQK